MPAGVVNMTVKNYDEFLGGRRALMAKLIDNYYKNL